MNTNWKQHMGLALCLTLPIVAAYAQNEDNSPGTLESEEIIIEKDFKAIIQDANKINTQLSNPQLDLEEMEIEYLTPQRSTQLTYQPQTLKPLGAPKQKEQKVQQNFVDLGFGTAISPLFRLGLHHVQNKRFWWYAQAEYTRVDGKEDYQKMSDGALALGLRSLGKKNIIQTEIRLGRERHTNEISSAAAMIDPIGPITDNPLDPRWVQAGVGIELKSNRSKKRKLNYHLSSDFDHYDHNSSQRLSHVNTSVGIHRSVKKLHEFSFNAGLENQIYFDTARHIKSLDGLYQYSNDDLKIDFGLGGVLDGSKLKGEMKLMISKQVVDEKMILFLDYDHDYVSNNLIDFQQINPHVDVFTPMMGNWRDQRKVGVKGSIGKYSYEYNFSNSTVKNMPLFIKYDFTTFDLVYDDKFIVNQFGIQQNFHLSKALAVNTSFDYFIYKPNVEKDAWHLPQLKSIFGLSYTWKEKIIAEAYVSAQSKTRTSPVRNVDTPGYADVNLAFKYKFSPRIGGFLHLNNLTNTKHEEWEGYRQLGFNAKIGASIRF